MALVVVQAVSKQFGTQVVLEEVTFDLHAGETVGLVGANGAGKTTLFRLITGEVGPDLGTVTTTRGVAIGYLRQESQINLEHTLEEEVATVFAPLKALEQKLHEVAERMATAGEGPALAELMEKYERYQARFQAAGGHGFHTRLQEVLGGLGFVPADLALPMAALSGGQKCRASLAKVLLEDRTLLLLDEPTNHLDIDAVRWLEKFLSGHHGGAVIISHDRYLLDRLCTRILEVEQRQVRSFPGNYSNYAATKFRRALTQQRQYEKDTAFIRKEQRFIERYGAAQRSKQAQGRRKRLERRLAAGEFVTEVPTSAPPLKLEFERAEGRAGVLVQCDELTMTYGANALFADFSLQVNAGERVGITGPNGVGKTTLLKIMLGEMAPTAGAVRFARQVGVGYYAQEHAAPDPQRTVLEEIRALHPHLSEQAARTLLGAYRFRGDEVFKALGSLSGGEQSRVRLASLVLSAPELLILDEPTNHLDIPAREALEEALLEFDGTVIVVSHDRYFLDRIVQRLVVLRPGGHAVYPGNYSYYIEQVEKQRVAQEGGERRGARKPRRSPPARRAEKRPRLAYEHLTLEELEALLAEREAQAAALSARFGEPQVYRDPEALARLRTETEAVQAELRALEAAWEERAADA
ncbi:MAG TPA: ABC-F family ATP-binding cassette domain-containing protein [Phycisphaerae bacterium]|nr:ABC-F family ATP-binding cassette domain-containing protein [Phycisphaerae bacterium]HNU45924.1 ABC-F family ATP-binding cassette domain-containing protein [Phycisphaerae bacterium]